ncbi:MAG TPA: c-type cytochrome [Ktedonobacteraceae bacterium]|nr:c-type cytochrome [Ktedonobacteraceae bacterium]
MIDPVQATVGIIVLLITVGALLYLFYSRTNAVEKTGFGALIMLSVVALMIPVFWIMETNGQTQAKIQQHDIAVQQGAALYAKYCLTCHGLTGQGGAGPKLNGNDAVNSLSDTDLMRIISAGIPDANNPSKLLMPAWGDQYGGPLSQPQIQYLFELVRSADPAYLKTNGYAQGPDANGFKQVPPALQEQNASTYQTAVAQATAGAGTGQFGTPVDMTKQKAVTIDIVNTLTGHDCLPACYSPINIKVKVGTKITWVNKSSTPHTVTAIKGLNGAAPVADPTIFDSGIATALAPNTGTYSYTVTTAAYNANPTHQVVYYCEIHPGMLAMLTIVP